MYSLNSIQRTLEFAEYKWGSISFNTHISVLHEHKQVFRVTFKLGICHLCMEGSSKRHSFNHVEFILKRVFTAEKRIIDLSSFLCFQLFKSCSSIRIIIRNYRSFFSVMRYIFQLFLTAFIYMIKCFSYISIYLYLHVSYSWANC